MNIEKLDNVIDRHSRGAWSSVRNILNNGKLTDLFNTDPHAAVRNMRKGFKSLIQEATLALNELEEHELSDDV